MLQLNVKFPVSNRWLRRSFPQEVDIGNSCPSTRGGSEFVSLDVAHQPFCLAAAPSAVVGRYELRLILGNAHFIINEGRADDEGWVNTAAVLLSPYNLNHGVINNIVQVQGYSACCVFTLEPGRLYDVVSFEEVVLFSVFVEETRDPSPEVLRKFEFLRMDFELSKDETVSMSSYNRQILDKLYRKPSHESGYYVWMNTATGKIIHIFSSKENNEAREVAPLIFDTSTLESFYIPMDKSRLSVAEFEGHLATRPIRKALEDIRSYVCIPY